MGTKKRGPAPVDNRLVSLHTTVRPDHKQWVEDQAKAAGDGVTPSAVVRACIRLASRLRSSGELTEAEFRSLIR